jgi:hypothetical protein
MPKKTSTKFKQSMAMYYHRRPATKASNVERYLDFYYLNLLESRRRGQDFAATRTWRDPIEA